LVIGLFPTSGGWYVYHFGFCFFSFIIIFVSIKDEYDNPETWEMIFQTIDEYLGVL